MKLAVIPVFEDSEHNTVLDTDQVSTLYDGYNILGDDSGKLTKEQVEVMAAYVDPYAFMPMSVHRSKETKNALMDAAKEKVNNMVRVIGIEVE